MSTAVCVVRSVLASTLAIGGCLAAFTSCGAEAPLATETSKAAAGPEQSEAEAKSDDQAEPELPSDLAVTLERERLAPGYVDASYPNGPYGFVQGSVVPNMDFLGWASPSDTGYDLERIESIHLGQFYDPDGDKGIELLMVNASAVWCTVCQAEFLDLREAGVYAELKPRGLEVLGVLFEDSDALPARYSDMQTWARVFEVAFPFVIDPGFKMGAFFDRSATPMNMVIDARTMELLISMTGYNPELYEWIERELTARGR
jgi:hypothetical protein